MPGTTSGRRAALVKLIDDANGIGHVFQVLRNFLTDSDTHPYDIHEILTFHQSLDTLYELTA